MTKEKVKRLLKAAGYAQRRVKQLDEQLASLRAMREKVTPTMSQAPGGGGTGNRIEELTMRIMELEEEQRRRILSYLEAYHNTQEAIDLLPEDNQKLILSQRYLEGNYWEDIARDMNYGRAQVFRIHDEAIRVLAGILKDDTK